MKDRTGTQIFSFPKLLPHTLSPALLCMENQGNSLHNLELQNFILNLVYFVSTCVTMNEPADHRQLTGKSAGPETIMYEDKL